MRCHPMSLGGAINAAPDYCFSEGGQSAIDLFTITFLDYADLCSRHPASHPLWFDCSSRHRKI